MNNPYPILFNRRKLTLGVVLTICWSITFLLGYRRFVRQDELLSVSLINTYSDALGYFIAFVVFTFPIVALIAARRGKLIYAVGLIFYLLFILSDVHRLTPYFIFYLAVFGVLIWFRNEDKILHKSLILIASGIYIASGLHKLNPGFGEHILPLIWFNAVPLLPSENIGYCIAMIEALLGLGLLFNYSRKPCVALLILTHLIIIWKLGPFKLNWNLIVWPWNFCMIMLLLNIYRFKISNKQLFNNGVLVQWPIILFFYALPFLSLLNIAPDNLGFKLYSGKVLEYELHLNTAIAELKAHNRSQDSLKTIIHLQDYSIRTGQLAISPEPWIYEKIRQNFENYYKIEATLIEPSKIVANENH